MSGQDKIFEMVTDTIVSKLEEGTIPWHKPWTGTIGMPRNLISNKAYRGINILLLGLQGYGSPYWVSFRQASKLGGHVRKGEAGTIIVFWKWFEKEEEAVNPDTGETEIKKVNIPFLRYYRVWNVEQCEGLKHKRLQPKEDGREVEVNTTAETIWNGWEHPEVRTNGGRAFYHIGDDYIGMPEQATFDTDDDYYSTLFHEGIHSTGHPDRLNRPSIVRDKDYGVDDYSKEELVAEIGACYLATMAGIERTIDNSVAYINGWLNKLKSDKRMVVYAAAQAEKAAEYILNNGKGETDNE
jgi:antirestriction protein ArdC